MKHYITIDGGTTNTRVSLVSDNTILDTVKIPLGARASMDGNNALREAIKKAIASLLERHALTERDVCRILASGMITSEFGLCCLPHAIAPAGIRELHDTMHETVLPDISPIPFVFIRGVKTVGTGLADTDMMRGEEAELVGIMNESDGECLYILPGSHSKLIETDRGGRITRFASMLTGEMIAALSSGTILRDAVDLSISEFDNGKLLEGCRYALEKGLSEALFKTRVLKNHLGGTPIEAYSFFLGAVLSSEIGAIIKSPTHRIVIGGRTQIKNATASLLSALSDKEIITLSADAVDASSTRGVIKIYEYEG